MRLTLALAICFGSAVARADAPTFGDRRVVPGFTLLASRISTSTPRLSDSFVEAHSAMAAVDASFMICLGADGHVTEAVAKHSTGDFREDLELARQISATWVYRPQPTPVCFLQPFRFQLTPANESPLPAATGGADNVNVHADAAGGAAGAAWLAYTLTLVKDEMVASKQGVALDAFATELDARTAAGRAWQQGRKDQHDQYLDALLSVLEAGFMSEYVIAYLGAPGWHLYPDQLRGLHLDAFQSWRAKALVSHRVVSHGRGLHGAAGAPLSAPGVELMNGVVYHTVADCSVGAELQHRIEKWESTRSSTAGIPIAVSSRDELIDVLLDSELRPNLLVHGVSLVSPRATRAYSIAASCAVEAKDLVAAESLLRRLTRLAPRDLYAPTELSHVLTATHRYDDAATVIDQVLARDHDPCHQAILWRKRGYISFERKAWPDAQAAYVKSLQLDPDNALALSELRLIDRLRGPGATATSIPVATTELRARSCHNSAQASPRLETTTPELPAP